MLSLLATGCSSLPLIREPARDYAVFLTEALNAKPERREALWRANRDGNDGDEGELRAALLQSVPEHSGYDPAAARRRLGALVARKPDRDIAEFARLRLAELRSDEDTRSENATLRGRVARLIEIESQMQKLETPP